MTLDAQYWKKLKTKKLKTKKLKTKKLKTKKLKSETKKLVNKGYVAGFIIVVNIYFKFAIIRR
jgi:hypothetical protein